MQKEPLVSVPITTYNRCEKLKKALDSVVNQTYKNLEIIIADNHSEDGTEELCREYSAKDPRIKYFRHNTNLGMTLNIKFALSQPTGEYRLGLCDDDWIDSDYIEKCINFANTHPDYNVIMPLTKLYDENYNLLQTAKIHKLNQDSLYERVAAYIKINSHNLCFGLCKSDIQNQMFETDGFIMKNRLFEDWVFMVKNLVANKAVFLDGTYFHKLNNGWTKDIESTKELWDVDDLHSDNFWEKLEQTLSDAILNDNFFDLYLDEKSKKKLLKTVKNVIFIEKLRKKFNKIKKKLKLKS